MNSSPQQPSLCDGGPARPASKMSIRTAIAKDVLAGMISNPSWDENTEESMASIAVSQADSLIAELTKDGGVL